MTVDMVQAAGDPQVGNLATPVNSSFLVKEYINYLPAYRKGMAAYSRGLEVGIAHGYWLYGPFAVLGPLRGTELSDIAGVLAAVGLVFILTVCLSIYSGAGVGVHKPTATVTTPEPPENLSTKEGWSEFASGFLIGGCGGAFFAYLLCQTPHLIPLQSIAGGVWSS
ncbi:MAG: photosystem I reaction center subunit XI [Leptolyngbyaceae cyanobacterium MO_188.B28]|nr:photosystem I reaction center subunit XI [Leptolyngbyaceae cyanobacterium MO_188.B28]